MVPTEGLTFHQVVGQDRDRTKRARSGISLSGLQAFPYRRTHGTSLRPGTERDLRFCRGEGAKTRDLQELTGVRISTISRL